MSLKELITALNRLKVETGSIACLGCGYEHNCGILGCAIIREATEKLDDFNAVFNEDAIVRLAGQCLKVEPGRLRELAEADKDGRVVVLPCKVGDKLYRVFDGNISEHEVQNMKYFARQGRLGIDMTPFFPDAGRFIGKTVFLTREEAEKALEAMKK